MARKCRSVGTIAGGKGFGLPFENACGLARNVEVSFKKFFEKLGAKDEDAEGRLELLLALHKLFGEAEFTSAGLKDKIDSAVKNVTFGESVDPSISTLQAACTPKNGKGVSPKSIGRALTAIVDAAHVAPAGVIVLRSSDPSADNAHIRRFHITYPLTSQR